MFKDARPRPVWPLVTIFALLGIAMAPVPAWAQQPPQPPAPGTPPPPDAPSASGLPPAQSPVYRVQAANERLEIIVNTSRILTLGQKVPQAQVNNPDILDVVPLSPTQVQISAKKPGVTVVNLWGEDKRIYTVDVLVIGDARELAGLLRAQFPKASLNVAPIGSSVMISGYVDQPELIGRIMRIAEEYYPKVINNITVSGVQQVLLHVRVMEVSRTKLRALGFDWAQISNQNVVRSNPSGLLTSASPFTAPGGAADAVPTAAITTTGAETFFFSILSGTNAFFGVLEAMRRDNLMKVLAEPNLVAISGRPSTIQAGGEYGYTLNGGITGPSVEFKEYGTRVDMVPVVLGNGRIRLEVRPSVSEIDSTLSVGGVPALKTRFVDTAVELRAGQTFAIAGLVQTRVEAENKGLPWVSELPYLGVPFRRVQEKINEVELLVMVTPELVDPLDASQVPPCGPGSDTTSPNDWELFMKGHLEVPKCCATCGGSGCATCAGTKGTDGTVAGNRRPAASRPVQAGPVGPRNPQTLPSPNQPAPASAEVARNVEPGFIGPIGYDVLK